MIAALDTPTLTAYDLNRFSPMDLVPADAGRPWMDQTEDRYAHRCLPLRIANASGWWLVNRYAFRAMWTGKADPTSVRIQYLMGCWIKQATSHFGYGVLTINPPYLFRTPPGVSLWVRGPANAPKDGIAPLEGLVETDWTFATFTLNWKFTRPRHWVTFAAGEPLAMLVPWKRGEIETYAAVSKPIESEPDLLAGHRDWAARRFAFASRVRTPQTEEFRQGWQKHYFQGVNTDGSRAPSHQTRVSLCPFRPRAEDAPRAEAPPERAEADGR